MNTTKRIEVLPYDSNWAKQFASVADKIKSVLDDQCIAIHHIGSTSVSGLASKGDLDILLVINCLHNLSRLKKIGYIFKGEFNIPLRYYFSKNTDKSKVNLHVCEKDHGFIKLNLIFRDRLRQNREDRIAYEVLKYKILQSPDANLKVGNDFSNYNKSKNDFIKEILKKSGYTGVIVNFPMHDSEWEATKNFRNKYFFESSKIEDPYTWTFKHKDHKHFVLYRGIDIIGYAHIQLHPENRVTLHIIVLDEKYQGKGYSKEFMTLIEKWLKRLQGIFIVQQ